jgi:hypothetical protein
MTPAAIYKAVRDLLVIAAIGFVVWRVYTDGKNAVTAQQLKQLQEQIEQQSIIAQQWHTEATHANTDLAASLARINAAPVLTHDWVRSQPSCPATAVLSAPTFTTRDSSAGRGAILPGPGEAAGDAGLRDTALADFKRFWEGQIAGWRAEYAQWPQP